MLKKFAAVIMAAVTALGTMSLFSACGERIGEPIDETKTQLYIGNYDGGVGTQWLYEAASRFEEKYKDFEFEPGTGKKGVEVKINPDKTTFHGGNILMKLPSVKEQIVFTEQVDYDVFASSGSLADVSDIFKDPLSDFGETESIYDKTDPAIREYLNFNGKVYAVPHYRLLTGLQYNVDLFEDYGFYFNADASGFVSPGTTAEEETRSKGPDGKTGVIDGIDYSYDDGLPATYDEFFRLCEYMYDNSVMPLIWTGQNRAQYAGGLTWSLYADYEGREKFMKNFNFSGDVDDIVTSFDNGKPVLKTETITPEKGYLLRQQVGRYYALDFMERLVKGGYCDPKSFSLTFSHLMAQTEFVSRWCDGVKDANLPSDTWPIAMLDDGNWWENEASLNVSEGFGLAETIFGEAGKKENRRFAMMPLPKVSKDQVGEKFSLAETNTSYAFINAYTTKDENILKLAKLFIQFCSTDQEMQYFTAKTGVPKGLSYEMPEEYLNKMTYYQQSVWYINSIADVICPYSSAKIYRNNASSLRFGTDWMTPTFNIAVDAFHENKIDAIGFFNGMAMSEADWKNKYSKDF